MPAQQHHHRKTRPDPNTEDPLSEPTVGRRIHAAYLRAGYNRHTFAQAMGLTYPAVDQLDKGAAVPKLANLMKASELVGFTLDELVYGHHPPHARRMEPELTKDAIKSLLQELRADADAIEALGEYERSGAGQYQTYTRSFVAAFVERYGLARREGMDRKLAVDAAKVAAANAKANAEAVALRLKAPPSDASLAVLGQRLAQTSPVPAKPKRRRA
jgi:transcriptional regulator with XRE-family HTH domain